MKRSLLTAFWIVFLAGAFAQQGVLDQTFGIGGKVVTTSPLINSHSIEGKGIALQQDGKIIVVGGALSTTDSSSFVVFRFNENGTLDNSFGLNGVVTTSVNLYGKSGAGAVAVQLDGKIVVGGYAVYDSAGSYNTALTRYNNDGTLDSSFGLNGIVNDIINPTWYEGNSINRIIILPNGKILAGGKNTLSIVYQYNSQGQLDMVYSTPFTSNAVNAILVQSDGKVLGGCSRGLGINRFKTTGSSDSSFGNYTGQSFLNLNYDSSYGYNACLQQNGKIILAGEAWLGGKSYIVMGRLTTDGVVDSSFGNNGNVITSVGNANDRATNLIQLTNGNLLVTGSTSFNNGTPGNSDFVLLQYNKDGLLDSSFGIHGKIITDFDGSEDNAISSTVQLDGKIIVLGRTFQNGIWKIAMARYERNSISNYNTIVGNVFFDKNSNAIKDPNETYYNMAKIEVVKPNFDTIGISS